VSWQGGEELNTKVPRALSGKISSLHVSCEHEQVVLWGGLEILSQKLNMEYLDFARFFVRVNIRDCK